MLLPMFILALLANLGLCNTSYFVFDNLLKRNPEATEGASHSGLNDAGHIDCGLWIKNGDSVVSRVSVPSAPTSTAATSSMHLIRTNLPTADRREPTWFWTTCGVDETALLVDWMGLQADNGRNHWGADDNQAWCLSGELDAWHDWANESLTNTEDWWPTAQYCYASMKLIHNGNVFGWRYIYPSHYMDRRELESVPKPADVMACEKDKAKTDAECDTLVEDILKFQMKHEENLEVAHQIPLDEDEFPRKWESTEEEEESSENRRRLMKL